MGDQSAIEWTEATWNPVTGCSKVSPGCAHCYAETLALTRLAGKPGYPGLPWTPANALLNVVERPERLEQPLRWRRPRMIFVNSMSDLFHEEVPDEFIAAVFAVMDLAQQHTFQVLTKRAERMHDLLKTNRFWHQVVREIEKRGQLRMEGDGSDGNYVKNVWLGVSIENRRYVHRADLLRQTPAAVRFISAEPLLGPLVRPAGSPPCGDPDHRHNGPCSLYDWQLDLTDIDWLIVGGESGGPESRRLDPDLAGGQWVRELRDKALINRSNHDTRTAFFFKQWGGRTPKSGGRLLDGRVWDEMPAVATAASP
jgi:protein gp37